MTENAAVVVGVDGSEGTVPQCAGRRWRLTDANCHCGSSLLADSTL